ncbi:MAG: hypothetical protein IKE43_11775 [Coriobacteriales bacterium]|nr:hypothetical protein [Coriobacteriales bacterium]
MSITTSIVKETKLKLVAPLMLFILITLSFAGCTYIPSDLSEGTSKNTTNTPTDITEIMELFNQRPSDTIPDADILIQAGEKQTIRYYGGYLEGTLEVTLIDSGIYNTIDDIPITYDLGLVFKETPSAFFQERGSRLAVYTLEIHNIDASGFTDYSGNYEIIPVNIFELKEDIFRTELASFSDPIVWDVNSKYAGYFALDPGETKLITIARWFTWVHVNEPPEHVVLTSGFNGEDQFDLTPNGWESSNHEDYTDLIQAGQKQDIYSDVFGYTGTIEVTLLDSAIFNSIEEAEEQYDLGTILEKNPPELYRDSHAKLAVFTLEIHNIDASTIRTTQSQSPAFTTRIFRIKRDLSTGLSVASISDLAENIYGGSGVYFSVEPGETKQITISCWFAESVLNQASDHVVLIVGEDGNYQFDLTPNGWNL